MLRLLLVVLFSLALAGVFSREVQAMPGNIHGSVTAGTDSTEVFTFAGDPVVGVIIGIEFQRGEGLKTMTVSGHPSVVQVPEGNTNNWETYFRPLDVGEHTITISTSAGHSNYTIRFRQPSGS